MTLRERESVRMLSLVAHAIGYKMIVGTHNTINVRCMWESVSSSSSMADVGACHTIDAQRYARGFTVLVWYGSLRAPASTIPGEHGKTPYTSLGINSMAGTDVCHTRRRRCNLPHASDINSVMGAYNHLVPNDVGNKT